MPETYYIKDVAITGTVDDPETISYEDLTDRSGVVLPTTFTPAPLVDIVATMQDVENPYLTGNPGNTSFTIARSELEGVVSSSVTVNIIISEAIATTVWHQRITPRVRTASTSATANTSETVVTMINNRIYIFPVPEEIWELELWYKYRFTVNDLDQPVDFNQDYGDALQDYILRELMLLSITKNPADINKIRSSISYFDGKYELKKQQILNDLRTNEGMGNHAIKAVRF